MCHGNDTYEKKSDMGHRWALVTQLEDCACSSKKKPRPCSACPNTMVKHPQFAGLTKLPQPRSACRPTAEKLYQGEIEPLGYNHQYLGDVVTSSYRHKVLQLPRRVQEQPEEHILQGKVVIIFSLSQYGAIASRIVSRNDQVGNQVDDQVGNQVDNQVEIKLRI